MNALFCPADKNESGVATLEIWNEPRKLTVYFEPAGANAIRTHWRDREVIGFEDPDMPITSMEDLARALEWVRG